MRRKFAVIGLSLAVLLPISVTLVLPTPSTAVGSTTPVFVIDANNSSTFTYSGTTVNSSVTESANSASGTSNSLTYEAGSITNSLVFGTSRYLNFANTVKPDLTNGISIQLVAYLTTSSYNGTWPRILAFGSTTGWGSGYDEFSIQLSDSGQMQVFMSKSGVSGTYTCLSTGSTVLANEFAMYSLQIGPLGVCRMAVNGSALATSNSEASVSFASKVPVVSNTWNFRVGSMNNNVQSTLPNGKIRSLVVSSGTTSTNSVTFMENGGTGYMASQLGSSSATLNSNTLTKSGYTLSGWNTKSDGSGTVYAAGAPYDFSAGSRLLYAQWALLVPSLSIPELSPAIYRTTYQINMSINSSGRYTFYDSGKRIAGCIGLSGSAPTVTCNWKPAKIGSYSISAMGKVGAATYYSNSSRVLVSKRSNTR
jgi:hypothetical protein